LGLGGPLPGYIIDKDGYYRYDGHSNTAAPRRARCGYGTSSRLLKRNRKMFAIRNLLIAFCGILLIDPQGVEAQCTAETEAGRRVVLNYATQYTRARPAGVPVVAADQVRPLANPGDSGVCQQLFSAWWAQWQNPEEAKPGWAWTYYQVGSLYYVVAHKTTPPVRRNPDGTLNISLNWSPLFIIDRNYQLVATIAR
jgi:hypothetical protein